MSPSAKKLKIATVVGARPQFVKAATVSRAFQEPEAAARASEILIHTGQHHDAGMSDVFFKQMDIPQPRLNLGVSGGTHGKMTAEMMARLEEAFASEKPDAVLVYGDTNSTLAASLTAAKMLIPVAHVEAGLRSFNMRMPEEINRALTDRVSRWLYCPTDAAVANLEQEGARHWGGEIVRTGDVMYDAALFYSKKSASESDVVQRLGLQKFHLATLHRAENTDSPEVFKALISALRTIAREMPVVLPLHPRTEKAIASAGISTEGITLLPPVGYFDMIELLKSCDLVLTDSGGVQKEAYFFGKICLTLRNETEWVELVGAQANFLVGSESAKILETERSQRGRRAATQALYGDGQAARMIVRHLLQAL